MRKISSLLFIFLSASGMLFSQYTITVTETIENFGLTSHNALSTTIYLQKKKQVENAWVTFMKEQRAKVKSKRGLIKASNAGLYQISSDTVNVYARFTESGEEQVLANIGFESGGTFVSSAEADNRFEAARKIVRDFAIKMTKQGVLEKIQEAEREVKKIERETGILEKDKIRLEYNIEKSKASITKSEEEIQKKSIRIDENKSKLDDQSKRVLELNESLKTIE